MHAPVPKLPARMPTERSRARRERRSDAARQPVLHVVMPGLEVARDVPRKGETITAFLRRTGWAYRDPKYGWQFRKGLPTTLEVNGVEILRKRWRTTRLAANDNARFVSYPLGGGQGSSGKQVLGLVALVAIAAFAAPLAGTLLGAVGLSSSTTLIGSLTLGQALATGITLGGALLINALTAPKAGATNDPNATTDQIYTVQAQGNLPKLGQPLPTRYGREKVYPDFAATPWGEFVGNDQFTNILLSQGMGLYDWEQILASDTPFWNPIDGVLPAYDGAQVEFYNPGEPVTLFPTNVSQSDEVTGQQLPHGTGVTGVDTTTPGAWLGGYVASPAGKTAYQLAVDYVFPAGCFQVDDQNNTISLTVHLTAERRAVNDAGAPIGDWVTLTSTPLTYANRSPIRGTFLVAVPEGRYEVRFRRDDGVPDSNKGASDVAWVGLRAYIVGTNNVFPDVSTIAIRLKSTQTTQGSYKFGVVATRKLPVWHSDTGTFVTEPTRNNGWAFLDAVTNAQYGSGHPLSKVDFNAIVNFAAGCDARGDHFDYSFTSAVTCPEAWDKILTPARSRHFWLGDTISVVRDEWRDVPSMLLTDREIVRGSTQVTYTMLGEQDPDAVIIEYVDEDTWLPASVQYPPNTEIFTAANPATKRIDGILNRTHAYREAAFYYLVSIYRRKNVQVGVEFEGKAITFGSVLRVQSELPTSFGYGGAVTAAAGRTLTLQPAPKWSTTDTNYVRLRRPNGKWFGPILASKGANNNQAVLDATDLSDAETSQGITLAAALARESGGEDPSFELGAGDNQSRLCMVQNGRPDGNGNTCTLTTVIDDERVHATDLGTPPILPVGQFPSNAKTPLIIGLTAKFDQGVAEPMLRASWLPTAGAVYYIADVSYDTGKSWINVYEGADNKFEKMVTLGALRLRVQAVGNVRGPYSAIDLEAPTIQISNNTVALNSLNEGVRAQVTTVMDDTFAEIRKQIAQTNTIASQALARTFLDKKEVRSQQSSLYQSNRAFIEQVQTTAADSDAAIAQTIEVLRATVQNGSASLEAEIQDTRTTLSNTNTALGDLTTDVQAQIGTGGTGGLLRSTVSQHTSAIATLNGYAAAQWSVLTDVNGNVAGLILLNSSNQTSSFQVLVNNFYVAFPGAAGGTPVPVFTIGNVNGVAKIAMRGDMLVDGSILTQMIAAGAITTVSLAALSINTSKLQINSVGIDQIISNAVTNTKVFATPNAANNSTWFAQSVNIQSGQAIVTWCAYHDGAYLIIANQDAPPHYSYPTLYVDGVAQKQWKWKWTFDGTSNSNNNYSIFEPFTVQYTVTGLSQGNHTFQLVSGAASSGELSGSSVKAGQIFIADYRNG